MTKMITRELVEALLDVYVGFARVGDAEIVAQQYMPDATIIYSDTVWAEGEAEILDRLREEFAHPNRAAMQVYTDKIFIAKDGQAAFVDETFVEADGTKGHVRMLLGFNEKKLVRIRQEWIITVR